MIIVQEQYRYSLRTFRIDNWDLEVPFIANFDHARVAIKFLNWFSAKITVIYYLQQRLYLLHKIHSKSSPAINPSVNNHNVAGPNNKKYRRRRVKEKTIKARMICLFL